MSFRANAVSVFLQGALTSLAALLAVSAMLAVLIIALHEGVTHLL
ncbi:hypothetical protein RNI52_25625 [Labrys neptuniae]|uniref:Uncharacterized protein n=1 Tax=Labrys neptuniae TaxID=376174 RepID=A0ABV3PHJ9_9HYPH|nr:hypothetical protein [Labrys neptuniae]MDT3380730.1 hypothetical protein [Labrys neptuniae]